MLSLILLGIPSDNSRKVPSIPIRYVQLLYSLRLSIFQMALSKLFSYKISCLFLISSMVSHTCKIPFRVPYIFSLFTSVLEARGGAVVEALRYQPEHRGIDSRWCHWNFRQQYGSGVDSTSNTNEYQEYFLGVKAAGA
jgi:hypothetical protein